MRLAIISDIHANLLALHACLSTMQKHGAEQYIFLGDIIGYGPDPEAVSRLVQDYTLKGAICIKGNHDHAVNNLSARMNESAEAAMEWTRSQLSPASKDFLLNLPLTINYKNLLFTHADASAPHKWHYISVADQARQSLAATSAHVTFCGHVHVPALYGLSATAKLISHKPMDHISIPLAQHRQWLAVIGACGQPRDGNPAAACALYDTDKCEITYLRAPYDVTPVIKSMRQHGLPESLITRLSRGI